MLKSIEALDYIWFNFNNERIKGLNLALALIILGVALSINIADPRFILQKGINIIIDYISKPYVFSALAFLLLAKPTLFFLLGMVIVAVCFGWNSLKFLSTEQVFIPFRGPLTRMSYSKYLPQHVQRLKKTLLCSSFLFFIVMVILMPRNSISQFLVNTSFIFTTTFIINILIDGCIFKIIQKDCQTNSDETGAQNSRLAPVLVFNPKIFPLDFEPFKKAVVAVRKSVWFIVSVLTLASILDRRPLPEY